jgi:disulfide bond formation protein DsbB
VRVLLDKYRDNLVLGVLTTSIALLIGALLFEHVGGLKPCNLCVMQRYAHMAVIILCLESLTAKKMYRKKLAHVLGFASSLLAAAWNGLITLAVSTLWIFSWRKITSIQGNV